MEEQIVRKQQTAKVVKQQLVDFKHSYIKQIKEELLEGELVKKKAKEDMDREAIKEQERKLRQIKTREELKQANQDLKRYNDVMKQKEEEESKRLQAFGIQRDRTE